MHTHMHTHTHTHTQPSPGLAVVPTLRSQVPLWSYWRKQLSFWVIGRPLLCALLSLSQDFFPCWWLKILASTVCNFSDQPHQAPQHINPRKSLRRIPKIKTKILLQETKAFTLFHLLKLWVGIGSSAGRPLKIPAPLP